MPNNTDLFSKVQQANLYFAKLMNEYVDSFVYSIDRDEKLKCKVDNLFELLEAIQYQIAKGLYYDNEVTKLLYDRIDCITPIFNSVIEIDETLIQPFISNSSVIYGPPGPPGPQGEKGDKGDTGVGIESAVVTDGDLIITYTDDTVENAGSVVGPGVAPGGTTGQALVKSSNTDYDTEWVDIPNPDLSVYQLKSEKNQPNGYAGVGSDGLIPSSLLPPVTPPDWGNIGGDIEDQTDLIELLDGKEPTIAAGTTSQYWRGDKSWQTLNKGAVGLNNVDNTSDADKPVSTAQQTALDDKQDNITLTTTGTSGAATFNPLTSTLNIPQYQGGVTSFNTRTGAITLTSGDVTTALGYIPVTQARTITINGVEFDLSEDREWVIEGATGVRTVETFTATAGQTVFTTGGYSVGGIDVYLNGARLQDTEYTASNETTVVFPSGLVLNDIVEVIIWNISSVEDALTLVTSGFGEDISYNSVTNTLTIDKYNWMDLARGYTVVPTLLTSTSTYDVYTYIYSSTTLYRKIMNDNSEDAFYSESALTNKLCEKKITL